MEARRRRWTEPGKLIIDKPGDPLTSDKAYPCMVQGGQMRRPLKIPLLQRRAQYSSAHTTLKGARTRECSSKAEVAVGPPRLMPGRPHGKTDKTAMMMDEHLHGLLFSVERKVSTIVA